MPSADKVVTQGDVHEEIDLPCNLNVEDLKIRAPLASTREHLLVFGGVTGTIADALERRQDVIVRSSPIGRSFDDRWILFVNGRWPINPKCSI